MRVAGYKLSAYDATYKRAYFDVQEGRNSSGNRVLEVRDDDSGITFVLEFEEQTRRHDPRKKRY